MHLINSEYEELDPAIAYQDPNDKLLTQSIVEMNRALPQHMQYHYLEPVTGFNVHSYDIAKSVCEAYYRLIVQTLKRSYKIPIDVKATIYKTMAAAKYKILETIKNEEGYVEQTQANNRDKV